MGTVGAQREKRPGLLRETQGVEGRLDWMEGATLLLNFERMYEKR